MLRVVGLLLGGLLGVGRVGLSGWGRSWIAPLSWSGLVGHEGHVVLAVSVGIVAHRHLEVPWVALVGGVRWALGLGGWGHGWWVVGWKPSGWCVGGGGGCLWGQVGWRGPGWRLGFVLGLLLGLEQTDGSVNNQRPHARHSPSVRPLTNTVLGAGVGPAPGAAGVL